MADKEETGVKNAPINPESDAVKAIGKGIKHVKKGANKISAKVNNALAPFRDAASKIKAPFK